MHPPSSVLHSRPRSAQTSTRFTAHSKLDHFPGVWCRPSHLLFFTFTHKQPDILRLGRGVAAWVDLSSHFKKKETEWDGEREKNAGWFSIVDIKNVWGQKKKNVLFFVCLCRFQRKPSIRRAEYNPHLAQQDFRGSYTVCSGHGSAVQVKHSLFKMALKHDTEVGALDAVPIRESDTDVGTDKSFMYLIISIKYQHNN